MDFSNVHPIFFTWKWRGGGIDHDTRQMSQFFTRYKSSKRLCPGFVERCELIRNNSFIFLMIVTENQRILLGFKINRENTAFFTSFFTAFFEKKLPTQCG